MPSRFVRWRGLQLAASGLVAGFVIVLVRLMFGAAWGEAAGLALPVAVLMAPVYFSSEFVCRAMPASRWPAAQLLVAVVGAAAVAGGLWAGVGYGWWELMRRLGLQRVELEVPALTALLGGAGALGYLLSIAIQYLLQSFEESAEAARRVLVSEVAHRDAELRALRAQVDPHFLFNSLHSIGALTAADPGRAREMCQLLADFLRESLAVGTVLRIPLGREVGLAEQYLRIEQVRFGRRLAVETAVSSDGIEAAVPPLILQPLVENAVRHGVATCLEGGTIRIGARRAGDCVVIEIENPRDAEGRARPGSGHGLRLVRRRLQAMFGDRAALAIEAAATSYRVRVTLPAGEAHGA